MSVHSGEELKVLLKPVMDPPGPSPQGQQHLWHLSTKEGGDWDRDA